MADPRDISLNSGSDVNSRRDVYAMIHIANIIRKNVLSIAPDLDAKSFHKFVNGPNDATHHAMLAATSTLPKTVTKSVVAHLGRYRVESKDNIEFSSKLERIFSRNYDKEMAVNFFLKNLTTARCNEKIVFLMQPYIVFRYNVKSRDAWLHKCRFIWSGAAFGRFPSLLPVIAAQIILYTIRIFIKHPSLSRKEELSTLAKFIHFLPGIVNVAKPRCGMGLSTWYREMARHRRIVLEAFLNEVQHPEQDMEYYNPPFCMMRFTSKLEFMSFIEHELKRCDKEETMENDRGKKRIHAEKDPFGEDSDIDDEDKELLQFGGYGGDMDEEEKEEEEESEEIEEVIEEDCYGIEGDMDDDTEEYSVEFTHFLENFRSEQGKNRTMIDSISPSYNLMKEVPIVDGEKREYLRKRCRDNEEQGGDARAPPRKKSSELIKIKMSDKFPKGFEDFSNQKDDCIDEEKNEEAFRDIFESMPALDVWDEEEIECEEIEWDSSSLHVLSSQDMARGFLEAQNLLLETSHNQSIGSSMNLIIPTRTGGADGLNDSSISSDSLPISSAEMKRKHRGTISPPDRSDENSKDGDDDDGRERGNKIKDARASIKSNVNFGLPPPHIQRAPWKKIREEDNVEDEDDDEVTWVETKIGESDEILFVEEKIGPNGGRGPQKKVVKMEDDSGVMQVEMEIMERVNKKEKIDVTAVRRLLVLGHTLPVINKD